MGDDIEGKEPVYVYVMSRVRHLLTWILSWHNLVITRPSGSSGAKP
jgi:hypothetical protein